MFIEGILNLIESFLSALQICSPHALLLSGKNNQHPCPLAADLIWPGEDSSENTVEKSGFRDLSGAAFL